MANAITKEAVQASLDLRREEKISHLQDMEAVGVIAGKRDRERTERERLEQENRERTETIKRRIREQEERERLEAEAYKAERAENLHGLHKAIVAAGFLCGFGGLHLIDAWRPDFAIVTGSVIILAGVAWIIAALAAYYQGGKNYDN